jgi:Putative auto-transporter adhesin, head GIN domain
VQSSGGSDLNASGLTVDEAEVNSSGGSDLSIAVTDSLTANASGGSDIRYTGQPRSVDVNASGGGGVSRR